MYGITVSLKGGEKREREDIKKKAHLQSNIGGGVERGFIDRVLMFQSQ